MGSRGEGIAGHREKKQRIATQQAEQGGTKDGKQWKDSFQRVKTPGAKPIASIYSKIRDDTSSLKGECARPNGANRALVSDQVTT